MIYSCLFLGNSSLSKLIGFTRFREIKRQNKILQQEIDFYFYGEIGIMRQKMRAHLPEMRSVRANVRILPRKSGAEVLKLFCLLARGNLRFSVFELLRHS